MQQEKEKKEADILEKFELRIQKDDMERHNSQQKFNKEINEKLLKIEEAFSNRKKQIDHLMAKLPQLVSEELKKVENCEKNKEETNDKPEKNDLYPLPKKIEQKQESEQNKILFDILPPLINAGFDVYKKVDRFFHSRYSKLPINSPEYWLHFSKFLKDDR